jgi:hypothetical protein
MGRQTVPHAARCLPLHRAARVSARCAVRHTSSHAPLSPCGEVVVSCLTYQKSLSRKIGPQPVADHADAGHEYLRRAGQLG